MKMFCSKCGKKIEEESAFCSSCGCPIEDAEGAECENEQVANTDSDVQGQDFDSSKMKKIKYTAIVMCFVGAILMLSALIPITSAKHRFNVQNYDYYMSQYRETGAMSSQFGGGGILGGDYASISRRWKDMADEAQKRIWTNRTISMVLVVSGGIIVFVGYKKFKLSKVVADGAKAISASIKED
jgi:hypothetical protein